MEGTKSRSETEPEVEVHPESSVDSRGTLGTDVPTAFTINFDGDQPSTGNSRRKEKLLYYISKLLPDLNFLLLIYRSGSVHATQEIASKRTAASSEQTRDCWITYFIVYVDLKFFEARPRPSHAGLLRV